MSNPNIQRYIALFFLCVVVLALILKSFYFELVFVLCYWVACELPAPNTIYLFKIVSHLNHFDTLVENYCLRMRVSVLFIAVWLTLVNSIPIPYCLGYFIVILKTRSISPPTLFLSKSFLGSLSPWHFHRNFSMRLNFWQTIFSEEYTFWYKLY